MACRYFDDCSGRSKLCKLREKWGSETKNETKWVSQSWQNDYCKHLWKYRECPDYIKHG